jgi:CubicO group peptidase (beta-lactamase class C family)
MARFALLYMNEGEWRGTQVIPADWISESTTVYSIVDSTFGVGYGYMWNIIPPGSAAEQLFGYPGFYHTGVGVHLMSVMPDAKLVIILRVDTDGPWTDLGEELPVMLIQTIINARIDD